VFQELRKAECLCQTSHPIAPKTGAISLGHPALTCASIPCLLQYANLVFYSTEIHKKQGLRVIGRTLSHYRILAEIGRGGMGVVYEAEDTMLGRRAALKFLPEEVAHEAAALARFQREARAASALNHPNICTIYEIGEQDGLWFIAMELLEGQPLDSVLHGRSTPRDKLLDWAIQIADALDAAHSRGIVHRDLKPSNIFLTKRGQLKVLDFGLAKIADPVVDFAGETSPGTGTLLSPLTGAGLAVGTAAYMSPEQARGDDLDPRSDLFSFGTVLYQMATGHLPFNGKTSATLFDAILNRDPAPIAERNAEAPAELQRIICKCLEKDREIRYQHASDLRADLKRLKRDSSSGQLRSDSASDRSASGSQSEFVAQAANTLPPFLTAPGKLSTPSKVASLASSEIVAAARSHRVGFAVIGVVAILLLAAATFGAYQFFYRPARAPFQNMNMTSITSGGDNWAAAMSPDGKYVATLRRDTDGRDSIRMRHLPTNSNTEIVPAGDSTIDDVTFGPDGNYVYFRAHPSSATAYDLYRVPVLGGPSTLLVHNIDSSPSFYAGAHRMCFMRYSQSEGRQSLLGANDDGSSEKAIYSGNGLNYRNPAWSPDGKRIVVADQISGTLIGMTMIDAASGAASHFSNLPKPYYEPASFAWMPDNSGLIVVFRQNDLDLRQIAYVSYPGAEFHRITNDLNRYGAVSLSSDGKTLSTVLAPTETSLDIFPVGSAMVSDSAATPLGSAYWFDWVSDDQVAFSSSDYVSIQLLTLSTGQRKTLFSSGDLLIYDLDACGASAIVFAASPKSSVEQAQIYALDLAGGKPRQITFGKADQYMRCTPDGNWLVYYSFDDFAVHKLSMHGGEPVKLETVGPDQYRFGITPDGKEVAVVMFVPGSNGEHAEFTFISLETGKVTRRVPAMGRITDAKVTPDGQNIGYIRRERGLDNLWLQPVTGGAPRQLTDFHLLRSTNQHILALAWSPGGNRIGVTRRLNKGDVVILRDQAGEQNK
jgi:eukaryotic-like serine/threonine-protein kinase